MIQRLIIKVADKVKVPSFLHGLLYVKLWCHFCRECTSDVILNYTDRGEPQLKRHNGGSQPEFLSTLSVDQSTGLPLAQPEFVIRCCLFAGTYKVQKIRNLWALVSFLLSASEESYRRKCVVKVVSVCGGSFRSLLSVALLQCAWKIVFSACLIWSVPGNLLQIMSRHPALVVSKRDIWSCGWWS